MEESKTKNPEMREGREDNGADEANLPFCTNAPSAEHARAHSDDEPCDDGREGKFE